LLGECPALDQRIFEHGTTVFPRLIQGDGDTLVERLRTEFETGVVPGRFFGLPEHFRVGLGGDPALTRGGLEQLARALG
jgi:aspartate/methionine/tyrosine aminotransferase